MYSVMYAMKLIILCTLSVTIANAMPNEKVCLGCPVPLSTTEAEKVLTAALEKVATGDGPNFKIAKINSGETQLVAGTFTKINADLTDADGKTSPCSISIYNKAWLPDGLQITIECEGKEKIERKYSPKEQ